MEAALNAPKSCGIGRAAILAPLVVGKGCSQDLRDLESVDDVYGNVALGAISLSSKSTTISSPNAAPNVECGLDGSEVRVSSLA
jgi:hypothetical protein